MKKFLILIVFLSACSKLLSQSEVPLTSVMTDSLRITNPVIETLTDKLIGKYEAKDFKDHNYGYILIFDKIDEETIVTVFRSIEIDVSISYLWDGDPKLHYFTELYSLHFLPIMGYTSVRGVPFSINGKHAKNFFEVDSQVLFPDVYYKNNEQLENILSPFATYRFDSVGNHIDTTVHTSFIHRSLYIYDKNSGEFEKITEIDNSFSTLTDYRKMISDYHKGIAQPLYKPYVSYKSEKKVIRKNKRFSRITDRE